MRAFVFMLAIGLLLMPVVAAAQVRATRRVCHQIVARANHSIVCDTRESRNAIQLDRLSPESVRRLHTEKTSPVEVVPNEGAREIAQATHSSSRFVPSSSLR